MIITSLVLPALLAAAPTAGPGTCVVRGTVLHLDHVDLQELDGAAKLFEVMLHGAAIRVTFDDSDVAAVAGDATLRFGGEVKAASVPLRVSKTTHVRGLLTLGPKSALELKGIDGADVSLVVHPDTNTTIGPFTLPCAALVLGDADPEDVSLLTHPPLARRVAVGTSAFVLAAAKSGDVAIDVAVTNGGLVMEKVAARVALAEVRARWTDGTTLHGFLAADAVTPSNADWSDEVGRIGGMCGFGVSDTYVGPATMNVGTKLFDQHDGKPWAVATAKTKIDVIGSDDWVEVTSVPGIVVSAGCVRTNKAFTSAAGLTYPPTAWRH